MTIHYDFDGEDFKYEADLSSWLDSLNEEEAYEVMYSMFISNPEYYSYFNFSKEELDSITSEDNEEVKEILSMIKEKDLFNNYKDDIMYHFHDDAYDEYDN